MSKCNAWLFIYYLVSGIVSCSWVRGWQLEEGHVRVEPPEGMCI